MASTMQRTDHEFYRKSRNNSIVKLVRERYVRDDIPCQSAACLRTPRCQDVYPGASALLAADVAHYVVPDISAITQVAIRYLEILEQEELTNIIVPQMVMLSLQQHDKTRTYKRLRQIVGDPRKNSVLFYNEICAETVEPRLPGESSALREERALRKIGSWYHQHTRKRIIILSEQFSGSNSPGVDVYSVEQYLNEFWPHHTTLQNLREVLKDAEIEEDLDTIRLFSTADHKKGRPVAGYTEYKSSDDLEAGIKSKRYVSGVMRINPSSREQASVANNDSQMGDIMIVGSENRNRAVHGDMVVVEILSDGNRATPSFDISYEGNNDEETDYQSLVTAGSANSRPVGRVVGIQQRNWRSYVATIQEEGAEQGGTMHIAIPLDPVIPKIRIRHSDVNLIRNQRIVVRIDSWPVTSQYPNGHFVRSLGPIHQLDTEISAILVEHGIPESQASRGFGEASLREMPIDTPESPWKPSPEELASRKDLRHLDIFSIDPPNCQDIDDALSVNDLGNGHIELGVHIADVSFFVKENSHTDLEARARGTTVYLADRRFDMLPSVLSERVCSLRHRVDRYAVSVIWTLDKNFKVLDTWFGRTVIRSACEMEYEQAQELLNGANSVNGLDDKLAQRLKKSVIKLVDILRLVRERRLGKGALELESSEVKFQIATEHNITDIIPKKELEVHEIVAEAMIMANAAVAERIHKQFITSSLLRHHPPPTQARFKMLEQAAASKGFQIDFTSNKTLAQSLEHIAHQSATDPVLVSLLKTMATMAMNEAGYISSGNLSQDDYYHYGLALPFYTHFTSPIRRYADVIVHRQLMECVQADPNIPIPSTAALLYNNAKLVSLCSNLNLKTRESKLAQRDSSELFQSLYVFQQLKNGPLIMSGIISEIRSNGFFVYVPRLVLKGPVYFKDKSGQSLVPLSLVSGNADDENNYITNCSVDTNSQTYITITAADLPQPIKFQLFDHVQVSLKLHMSHAHRHKVHMTLVGFEQHQIGNAKLSTKTLTEQIISSENREKELLASVKQSSQSSKASKAFKQTAQADSVYAILESFRQMSIIEDSTDSAS